MSLTENNYYQKVLLANKYKLIGEMLFKPDTLVLTLINDLLDETLDYVEMKEFSREDLQVNLEHDLIAFACDLKESGKMVKLKGFV